jgi:putative ABC transport system ATP-binding protein
MAALAMPEFLPTTATVPTIELRQVSRVYGSHDTHVKALDCVDLTVSHGEFVALMGPSGSGKSTCLNMMGCLDRPTSGEYFFQGVEAAHLPHRQRALLRRQFIGFVFQGFNLLTRTTALENVELPLIYRRIPASERRRRAKDALASVGLSGRENHTPGELSGGQQQRVAIARAIVSEPTVVLADEPTGNLDTAMSTDIMRLLTALNTGRGLTIVMVTHEPANAAFASREVHFRDGRIVVDTRRDKRIEP